MTGFFGPADTIDVRDPRSVLARLLARGLRAERVEVWRGERTHEIRLRAPVGVWAYPLDAPEGDWARWWARCASRSEQHVEAYTIECRPELVHAPAVMARELRAIDLLFRCYPTIEVLDHALAAVVAACPAPARAERLATPPEVAEVLGWPLPQLRAAMRRGDVRSVPGPGGRRVIPWSEVERLVAETTTPGAG